LGTHHQVVLAGLADPPQVVPVLSFHHRRHFLYTETTLNITRFRTIAVK
jgi:hypothetical protein